MKIDENILYKLLSLEEAKKEIKQEEKEVLDIVMEELKRNSLTSWSTNLEGKNISFEIIPEKKEPVFDTVRFKIEEYELSLKYQKEKTTKEKLKMKID